MTKAASEAARLLQSKRTTWAKRDVPHCACGCGLTLARAMKRHPARAAGSPNKNEG